MSPAAFLLTWTTYGSWLHGDPRGSADDTHNQPGTPYLPADRDRAVRAARAMRSNPVILDNRDRAIVRDAIETLTRRRAWIAHALNVRSNHIHFVVSAPTHRPELVIGQCKSWATRALRIHGRAHPTAHVWTKMGSTRWLNSERSLERAVQYVLYEQ